MADSDPKAHGHPARIDRAQYDKTAPDAVAALMALGKAVDASGLDKSLTELVKLRASQINGCAFCVQMHINLSRQLKTPQAKLDQLAVWTESGLFSLRERAALAWTETLTRMATGGVPDAAYTQVQAQFSESEIVFLTAAISNINAWNRIAGALHFTPPPATGLAGSTP